MAMRTRPKPALYDEDFYVWTERQAALLRERRFDALDMENLIEEVEDLGRSIRSAVLNNASVVMEHLLKLQLSPALPPRAGWTDSIIEHRRRLDLDITPQLRRVLDAELPRLYALARRGVARSLRAHGEEVAADALPEACPYALGQILDDWWP
jgi:hypothetical protein